MEYKFNGEVLTLENLEKAKEWHIQNAYNCIEEAKSGKVWVNDLNTYIEWQMESIHKLQNTSDYSWSLLQRAYYFQTGKSIALLP